MKIRKMTADFSRLQGETLELGEGLNVVAAPIYKRRIDERFKLGARIQSFLIDYMVIA